MKVKELIKAILITFISISIGWCLGYFLFREENSQTPSVNVPIEVIKPEKDKIDSLKKVILKRDSVIDYLRDSIKKIDTTRIYKVDSIRNLPTTQGVEFLRSKLREFESKYNN